MADARKHGVRSHQVVNWVRRKIGGDICIWRNRSDHSLGCAVPCLLCQRELLRFDLRVHCSQASGEWFSGRMSDPAAPQSFLTLAQRKQLGAQQQQQQQRLVKAKAVLA